ncbi:phage tail protein [Chitinophaga sp. G-6-1-13]|uniref:Phage tail protein n=1 Tax=Chitinophaga fulva TaxID=2728842 RepID=A0A848GQW6_9BACT|nr:tail fiber protein [Chitinophaga fulva]NML39931.1 phage tail protein [Chitinophaga fulva]
MDEAFLGEIFLIAFNYAPIGFELCNGQELQIADNQQLFSLLGTTYGGNGQTTFALPNLQGRVVMGPTNYIPGEASGSATKALTPAHISNHTHAITSSDVRMKTGTTANILFPTAAYPAPAAAGAPRYSAQADEKMMELNVSDMVTPQGGAFLTDANITSNNPVDNLMPSLCMTYVIAVQGIYPQF